MSLTVILLDGQGNPRPFAVELVGGAYTFHSAPQIDGNTVSGANPMPVMLSPPVPSIPNAFEVMTGGSAVIAFQAGAISAGGYITNPPTAAGPLYVDPVSEPGTSAPGSRGTTSLIYPGQTFVVPPNWPTAVWVNSDDDNHQFTAVSY